MKKVYLDELEEVGNELISYSKNNIANKIEELKQVTNNFEWQSPAYNIYIREYNLKISNLERMNESLTILAEYLVRAKESYNDTNFKINNAYDELLEKIQKIGKW